MEIKNNNSRQQEESISRIIRTFFLSPLLFLTATGYIIFLSNSEIWVKLTGIVLAGVFVTLSIDAYLFDGRYFLNSIYRKAKKL